MFPIYMYPRTGTFESRVLTDITNPPSKKIEQKDEPMVFPDAFTMDKKELDSITITNCEHSQSVNVNS